MKNKILNIIKEHSSYIQPEEGSSYKAVDENDFNELADELTKEFEAQNQQLKELLTGMLMHIESNLISLENCPYVKQEIEGLLK